MSRSALAVSPRRLRNLANNWHSNCYRPERGKFCRPWGGSVGEWASSALAGKRIVVTRTVAQSGELFEALRARGAEPVLIPLIRIVPVEDYGPLDAALSRLRSGDWIVLTSQNAVAPVAQRGRMLRDESFGAAEGIQVAAVGPASENAARA